MKDTHYFTIVTRKLISLSNSMFGVHEVSIYEWKNEKVSNKIPDIQMRSRCNTFTIYNTTYIVCGREYSTQTVIVMRWFILLSQTYEKLVTTLALILIFPSFCTKFVHHRSIPTHGAMGWDSFTTTGDVFFVVVNRY